MSHRILASPSYPFRGMGQEPVIRICSTWDIRGHSGEIALYGRNGKLLDSRIYTDAEEFQLALDLLQNEEAPQPLDAMMRQLRRADWDRDGILTQAEISALLQA